MDCLSLLQLAQKKDVDNNLVHPLAPIAVCRLDSAEKSVAVVLGPGRRELLSPFFLNSTLEKIIVVDIYDPSLYNEDLRSYKTDDISTEYIAKQYQEMLQKMSDNDNVKYEMLSEKIFTLQFLFGEIQRTIIYLRDDYSKMETIEECKRLAGDSKIRAMIHGNATYGNNWESVCALVKEVKDNKGIVLSETIQEQPLSEHAKKIAELYQCDNYKTEIFLPWEDMAVLVCNFQE